MRNMMFAAMALIVIGCGGGGGGGPRTYSLVRNVGFAVPAGACTDVAGPFTIPTGYQDFDIIDTPVGIGSDSMEVGIMSEADLVASGRCNFNLAIADFTTVGSFSSPSGPVVAGALTTSSSAAAISSTTVCSS